MDMWNNYKEKITKIIGGCYEGDIGITEEDLDRDLNDVINSEINRENKKIIGGYDSDSVIGRAIIVGADDNDIVRHFETVFGPININDFASDSGEKEQTLLEMMLK